MIPEVRTDAVDCSSRIHQNAAERAITKLLLQDVDTKMGKVISYLWAKEKHFRKQTGMYSEKYQCNIPDVDKGNSAVLHEQY